VGGFLSDLLEETLAISLLLSGLVENCGTYFCVKTGGSCLLVDILGSFILAY
jgi:hypothetical protein